MQNISAPTASIDLARQVLILADEEIERLQYALIEGVTQVVICSRSGDELVLPTGKKTGRKIAACLLEKLEQRRHTLWVEFLRECEGAGLDAAIELKRVA